MQWLLYFCNQCWSTKAAPPEWATASVALLYKKGDPAACDNYRPICLLSIAYKLFASMMKERLLQAGVEKALWSSQFGFRSGYSTEDAIFIARRRIELARGMSNGKISLLALDWSKAFDSISELRDIRKCPNMTGCDAAPRSCLGTHLLMRLLAHCHGPLML